LAEPRAEAVAIAAVTAGWPPGDNTRAKRSDGLDQATWEPSYRPFEGESEQKSWRQGLRRSSENARLILQSLIR